MAQPTPKHDIQQFWKSLYDSLHGGEDSNASREGLRQGLEALEDMFRYRRHMAVVEMALAQLSGKAVLEVGSGAGSHSAMFALHGAHVTSVDLTLDRVRATAVKFALLQPSANGCIAVQGDAEGLPFGDNAFDIVYSNGVLHHTNDTEAALAEVYRVLKPGGKAVIMLYCKSSWHYWFNLLLCEGLLRGRLFGNSNWLGNVTEWGGKRPQTAENPITRCYSRGGIKRLFRRFRSVAMRKGEFYFYLIPKIGGYYRAYQIRRYGTHPGGLLAYGEPWPIQSPLELRLGRSIGFAWFISATKPF